MTEHTVSSFDDELQDLARMIAEMGGLAEQQVADAVRALTPTRSRAAPSDRSPTTRRSTRCSARSRSRPS